MIKKIFYSLLFITSLVACKESEIESTKPKLELISQNTWKLDRFSTVEGQTIQQNALNDQAILLYIMDFEFKADGEVRGVDKTSKQIVDRGIWEFINDEQSVNVKLGILDYDFQLIELKPGKLTLQAPTGNFLSIGEERINLEFSATQ